MSKRKTNDKDNGELEFTRAAYDALKDTEDTLGYMGTTHMTFDRQRGVLRLVVAFWDAGDPDAYLPVVKTEMTWPNANGSTFGAFLFQQCNKAVQMAESHHNAAREEKASMKSAPSRTQK